MTAPRQVLPGTTYLITRRCSEGRFFLKPSRLTSEIFLYVLAVASARHGVLVHVACVMSNHFHLLLTDPGAKLPEFMRDVDSLVARATNASLGRWEGFWSSEASYNAVTHGSTDDVVAKAAYVLANPVAAGLVDRGSEWPGIWTAPEQLGVATLVAPRPKVFFRPNGGMPGSAELVLTTPPGLASAIEFQERVATALSALESETRRKHQAERRSFLGRARVLAQKPDARPSSDVPRRTLSPRVAARDKWQRAGLLWSLKQFLRDYREAWHARRQGRRDVIFPAGTYLLRVLHDVPCAVA